MIGFLATTSVYPQSAPGRQKSSLPTADMQGDCPMAPIPNLTLFPYIYIFYFSLEPKL